ncbi:MAG: phosphoenolpyruvate carboxylase, partial [Proteobacteria bacterium]|nr:phosphoenolpyruvate carboxylase [Pseudomonadota bacterium]
MSAAADSGVPDKDLPLREDIRRLGRVLGAVVRDQEGEAVFALVERVRQSSIRFHRDGDAAARRELEATLDGLSRDHTIAVIRAYNFFSHLANIAEDQHHIRRTRAHALAASAPREGTLAFALGQARAAGVSRPQLQAFFKAALVGPVLTAHPTEIRRKSTIDREMEVARLLDERDRLQLTPEEAEASDEALRRAILTLWQTGIIRQTRLNVVDEVANGLSYYDYTFLRELPRLYGMLEDQIASLDGGRQQARQPEARAQNGTIEMPSFLRLGSWIGGDRDGNPFVNADSLRQALRLQSRRALTFYLEELHELGAELSLDARLVKVSDSLTALAERSPDPSPQRAQEPYRLAISGAYARLAATARALDEFEALRQAVGAAPPYPDAEALRADLDVIDRSLTENGS